MGILVTVYASPGEYISIFINHECEIYLAAGLEGRVECFHLHRERREVRSSV